MRSIWACLECEHFRYSFHVIIDSALVKLKDPPDGLKCVSGVPMFKCACGLNLHTNEELKYYDNPLEYTGMSLPDGCPQAMYQIGTTDRKSSEEVLANSKEALIKIFQENLKVEDLVKMLRDLMLT